MPDGLDSTTDSRAPHTIIIDKLARPHPRFVEMSRRWEKITDLLEGVKHMRTKGELYIPKMQNESTTDYKMRVEETELYPGLKRALDRVLSLPFSQMVTLEGELPEVLKPLEMDIDEDGTDLTLFTRDVAEDAVAYGKTHILTDFPVQIDDDSGEAVVVSKAQEDELNRRPRLVHIPARSLFSWQEGRVNGKHVLTEIRYFNTRYEVDEDQDDAIVTVQQIIILSLTTFEVHEARNDTDGFELVSDGPVTWEEIPLTIMYTNKTGFMTARSPLEELADANIAHWRDTSLHTASVNGSRTTLWFFKGFSKEEVEKNIAMGARAFVCHDDMESDVKAVEHDGKAIDSSRQENDKLEQRVDRLGAEPLNQRSSTMVATGIAINNQQATSDIQAWLQTIEMGMREAFIEAFNWVNEKVPEGFAVKVYRDFRIPMTAQDSEHLLNMRRDATLDLETYLEEEKRRGTLDRDREVAVIMERVAAETSLIDRGGDRDEGIPVPDPEADADA